MLYKGILSSAASGKLNGIVASHNRSGTYFRALKIPVNPNTDQQVEIRNAVSAANQSWMSATQLTRDRWDTYGGNVPRINAVGDQIFVTGQNWYVGYHTLRAQAGLAFVPTVAPVTYNRGATGVTGVSASSEDEWEVLFNPTVATWEAAVGGALLAYVTRPFAPSRNFRPTPYQLAEVFLGAVVAPTSPLTLDLTYPVQSGERAFVRFVAVSPDGRFTSGDEFVVDGVT